MGKCRPPTLKCPPPARALRIMRVSQVDRNHIEGLSSMTMRGGVGLTEEQVSSRALVQLAADPPA
eukprot:5690726-Prymnesium_polylepis.2